MNPDCIEHATIDHIMDTKIKGTHQHEIQLYRVIKVGQLLHQGKWLTKSQIQHNFPHLMEEIDATGTIASFGGE
jgi:hypothetical protein